MYSVCLSVSLSEPIEPFLDWVLFPAYATLCYKGLGSTKNNGTLSHHLNTKVCTSQFFPSFPSCVVFQKKLIRQTPTWGKSVISVQNCTKTIA